MFNNECATTLCLHVCAGMDEDDCVWSQVHCVHYRIMDMLHKHPLSAGEKPDHVDAIWNVSLIL